MSNRRIRILMIILVGAGAGTGLPAAAISAPLRTAGIRAGDDADSLFRVDCRKLVSRADLDYDRPASRSEEGMPVGNGRVGELLEFPTAAGETIVLHPTGTEPAPIGVLIDQ